MNSGCFRFSLFLVLLLTSGSIARAECQKTPAEIAHHAGQLLRQSPEIFTISPAEREAIACLADAVEKLANEREEKPRSHDKSLNSDREETDKPATGAARQ